MHDKSKGRISQWRIILVAILAIIQHFVRAATDKVNGFVFFFLNNLLF